MWNYSNSAIKTYYIQFRAPWWDKRNTCLCKDDPTQRFFLSNTVKAALCAWKKNNLYLTSVVTQPSLLVCVCACLSCLYMKGMTLTKRSSTFVKYYFPCEEPEGGGSSYNKSKLFAMCLINKTDKLLGFSLYLLVGSQVFGNRQQIMLFSMRVLAFSRVFEATDRFQLRDWQCPVEVNENSCHSPVSCTKNMKLSTSLVNVNVLLIAHPLCCNKYSTCLFYLGALEDKYKCHTSQPPFFYSLVALTNSVFQ